jgi:heat shock protein HtpX
MYDQIASNKRKSFFLLFIFILFIILLGYLLGEMYNAGYAGLAFAFVLAIVISLVSFYSGDKMVLAISRAKIVEKKDNPYLVNTVEGLAIAANLPPPKIYQIEDSAPNAFATGRNPQTASVTVTSGLVQKLNRLELEGVIAHEISHIKNFDIRYATLVVVLVGTVVLISDWMRRSFWWGGRRNRKSSQASGIIILVAVILSILAPLIAKLIQLAISRQREYLADANGALLTRYPEGLASALEKISKDTEPLEVANKATAHLYVVNPLLEHRSRLNDLFSTHPPVEERIKKLRAM